MFHFFVPGVKTESEITKLVRLKPKGWAHPFRNDDNKQALISSNGDGTVHTGCIQNKLAMFTSSWDTARAESETMEFFLIFKECLTMNGGVPDEYSFVFLNQGDTVRLSDRFVCAAFSNKNTGQFFDLQAYGGTAVVCYNKTLGDNMSHSDDILINGRLAHIIKMGPKTCGKYVISVVGYNMTPLFTYKSQQPALVVIDWKNKTVFCVPLPLDQETLGKSTMAHLMTITITPDGATLTVLKKPITAIGNTGSNTGYIEVFSNKTPSREPFLSDTEEKSTGENEVKHTGGNEVNYFVQNDAEPFYSDYPHSFFGSGVDHDRDKTRHTDHPNIILPIFCNMVGPPAALAIPFANAANPAILEIGTGMTSAAAAGCEEYRNNLLVIVHSGGLPINKTDLTGLCMVGYFSIVVININGKLFFLRGADFEGLTCGCDKEGESIRRYKTGDDVTEVFKDPEWIVEVMRKSPYPSSQCKDTPNKIIWGGKNYTLDEIKDFITRNGGEWVCENTIDLTKLLEQLCVVLNDSEMESFKNFLKEFILKFNNTEFLKKKIQDLLKENNFPEIKKISEEIKTRNKTFEKKFGFLFEFLFSVSSTQGVKTLDQSISRLMRRNAIQNNVKDARDMPPDKQALFVVEHFDDVLILPIESPKRLVDHSYRDNALGFDPRLFTFDSFTLSALTDIKLPRNDPFYTKGGIMSIVTFQDPTKSRVVIPLHGETREPPSNIDWATETNTQKYSFIRIWMRYLIAHSTASREHNIEESSDKAGFIYVRLLIDAMYKIIGTLSKVPTIDDFDNTTCAIIRSLFYTLMATLASTNKTMSPAYKLMYRNTSLKDFEFGDMWIYIAITDCFPYTGWDMFNVSENIKKMFVISCRKEILGDLQEIRDLHAKVKKTQKVETPPVTIDTKWLKWLHLVVVTVFKELQIPKMVTIEESNKLIAIFPTISIPSTRNSTKKERGLSMVRDFLKKLLTFKETWEKNETKIKICRAIRMLLCIILKYSGKFYGDKEFEIKKFKIKQKIRDVSKRFETNPIPIQTILKEFVKIYNEYLSIQWAFQSSGDADEKKEESAENVSKNKRVLSVRENLEILNPRLKAIETLKNLPTYDINTYINADLITFFKKYIKGDISKKARDVIECLFENPLEDEHSIEKAMSIVSE